MSDSRGSNDQPQIHPNDAPLNSTPSDDRNTQQIEELHERVNEDDGAPLNGTPSDDRNTQSKKKQIEELHERVNKDDN